MFRIEMLGEPLCHYGDGRMGWGRVDVFNEDAIGIPVEFATEDEAYNWSMKREQFTRGSNIIETRKIKTGISREPKKRGRPATGKALTAAERKAAQRAALPGYSMDVSMTQCSDTALNTAMQRALSKGDIVIGEMLAAEYMRRIKDKSHQDKQTRPGQTKW